MAKKKKSGVIATVSKEVVQKANIEHYNAFQTGTGVWTSSKYKKRAGRKAEVRKMTSRYY